MGTDFSSTKKNDSALREEKVLEFWRENKIFKKSLDQSKGKKEFVFYEGPPTANGTPGLHHLEARAFKDAIPRYKTMRGYHVRRKGGWDTHGLPVELQVERKLNLNSKKAIEEYGVAKFNTECRKSVWEYVDLWRKFTDRIGFWVDQENPYVTYDNDYIESVWNIIKNSADQNLLYKDYKVVPWCPRCGTALSSHELAQGYETVKDLSVTAKFKIADFPDAYFLAWTTTPWTLPGNLALAVGKDITYVEAKVGKEILVLAKERLSVISEPYEIIAEHKGSEMAGMAYEPVFNFTEKNDKTFKIYVAPFVNTAEGTGIVHTAVMYGQDDFVLGSQIGLPKRHLVDESGRFVKGTDFLEGRFVRDEETAVEIIKNLAGRGLLFKKEKHEHSYPHCWRCQTALIYYARDSWYIKMSDPKVKQALIAENEKINWEPAHTKDGRFGQWLEEVKDWAISRERYWGTPLPVWESGDKEKIVIDSVETLKKYTKKSGNKFFFMRHGEAEHNVLNICSGEPGNPHHLTENGRKQIVEAARKLANEKIDIIIRSPFVRAKETAEILTQSLGFSKDKIIEDERIREYKFGKFNMQPLDKYQEFIRGHELEMDFDIPGGESLQEAKNRFGQFLYDIDGKYQNKNILVVTHGIGMEILSSILNCLNKKSSAKSIRDKFRETPYGVPISFSLSHLPHNENFELDLHRPFIDDVVLVKNGKEFRRVKEVMDVWLDSGAMPFAQDHYPFENKDTIEGKGYPADYISEAIDQTRGWFYTLHAVGVLMGRGRAFKNVICLGHLLDAEGKKMSKSLGNIVDPWSMIEKYGADTLRLWMYAVNQPGESKNFDEKTVNLLHQQFFGLLYNVLAFYELYRDKSLEDGAKPSSKNVLDKWVLARLDELVGLSTKGLDNYKLLEPVRLMKDFIEDLSTWYLRRSRERIKSEDEDAKRTLYFVLKTLVKLMAPFAPFSAEDIWQRLKNDKDKESVHLESWPQKRTDLFEFIRSVLNMNSNSRVLERMWELRAIVTLGLRERQVKNIPVRQPLHATLHENVKKKFGFSQEYLNILKEELNLKEVRFALQDSLIKLDFDITPELRQEGNYRELARALQDIRKKQGLKPSDGVVLSVKTDNLGQKLIQNFENDLKKTVLISKINFSDNAGEEVRIKELVFRIKIDKI